MSQRPRILYLNRVSQLGGAERMILLSMEQAAAHGYHPILACPKEGRLPEFAREQGFETIPCEFNRMRATTNPLTLLGYAMSLSRMGREVERICRSHDISLLHPHGPVAAVYGVRAARSLGIPMLVHLHDAQPPSRQYAMAVRYAARGATSFVCVAYAVLRRLQQIHPADAFATVLYNGVDQSFLEPVDRACPELEGPGPRIGIAAQIIPWKGQDVFLQAAEQLAPRFPTAHFYIIGGLAFPEDQPFLDRLRAMAKTPQLEGRVTFTGFQRDVPGWMSAMDVIALCSVEDEAQPMVALEAMALGRKLVGTDIGGTSEIIKDRATGRLVPHRNPTALADAIAESLTLPGSDDRGARARRDIEERFTPTIFGQGLARLYAEALSGRRPGERCADGAAP